VSILLPDVSALQLLVRHRRVEQARQLWASTARWPEAVAAEVPPRLRSKFDWLGEPIEITDDRDVALVDRIRRATFGGSGSHPTEHLPEAQILFLMSHDELVHEPVWLTADPNIADFAAHRAMACRSLPSDLDRPPWAPPSG